MTQLAINWAVTTLPVSGRTPQARHASATGAQVAATRRGALTRRYLDLLATAGPLSDMQAALMLGCALSSICSVRNGCGALVRPSGRYEIRTWALGSTSKRVMWERAA